MRLVALNGTESNFVLERRKKSEGYAERSEV